MINYEDTNQKKEEFFSKMKKEGKTFTYHLISSCSIPFGNQVIAVYKVKDDHIIGLSSLNSTRIIFYRELAHAIEDGFLSRRHQYTLRMLTERYTDEIEVLKLTDRVYKASLKSKERVKKYIRPLANSS